MAPLHIVINARSGSDDSSQVRERLQARLESAGRAHEFHLVEEASHVDRAAQRACEAAERERGVVVAVGGDGTLSAVAQAVLPRGLPMGVVPQGTFNYFGRTHGIPEEAEAAMRVVLEGRAEPVQLGQVNGRCFLVSASVGLYSQVIEDREAWKARFGRRRFVAVFAGLSTLLSSHRQLDLELSGSEGTTRLRTLTLLAGNNALQLEQVGLPEAPQVEHGRLAFITVAPLGNWGLLGLMLRGAMGSLADADAVRVQTAPRLRVRPWRGSLRHRVKVAIDGEITTMSLPLDIGIAERPLQLLKLPAVGEGRGA